MRKINVEKVLADNKAKMNAAPKPVKGKKVSVRKVVQKVVVKEEVKATASKPIHDDVIANLELEYKNVLTERAKLSSGIYQLVYSHQPKSKPIHITHLLSKVDVLAEEGSLEIRRFGFRFLSKNGTSELIDFRKAARNPLPRNKGVNQPRGKFNYTLKQRGQIMLQKGDQYKSIMVSCIYEFKGFNSNRWIPVVH
ncbi:MAG: hypothetical protein AAF363_18715 [Bacteroidota bacterium]